MEWTAEITNDPLNDYAIIAEILFDGHYIGRLFIDNGNLYLKMYPLKKIIDIPFLWLSSIAEELKDIDMTNKKNS